MKDYLFPEIRALEDRTDIWSIKEAMKISKVSDRGVTNESDMLFTILKDIYYQQDPLFEDMKMLSKPNIEKTG